MEFYLVDELECNLTVFHPYRSLLALCGKKSDVLSQSTSTSAPAQSKSASSTGSVLARGTTSLPTRGSATASSTDTVEAGELGAGIEGGEKYWGTNLGKLILDEKTLQLAWFVSTNSILLTMFDI
jgi:cyclin C